MIVFGSHFGLPIAAAAPARFNIMQDACVARLDSDGQVMGGFLFTDYTGPGGSYLTHCAGLKPGWVNRSLLFNAANFAFNHAKCGKLFGQVHEKNKKALDFDLKLGWKHMMFLEGVFPDGGCHVLAMSREDCRWLNMSPRKGG